MGLNPHGEAPTAGTIQDSIGWGLVFEGCLATQWREEQELYLKAFKLQKSSKRWTIALLTRLMATAWDMWQHCNEALQNSETNKREIIEDNINQEIWLAYGQGQESFPPAARPLLQRPLQKLLRFPVYYKKQWMATLKAIQTKFQLHQEGLSRGGQQQRHKDYPWTVGSSDCHSAPMCKLSHAQQC